MLNIGVIGCGAIGRDHIRRLTDLVPGCQVVACADYFEEAAIKVASQYDGVTAYKTGEECIQEIHNMEEVIKPMIDAGVFG